MTAVEFWFDPTCPHTWRTSRWLVRAAKRQGISVEWHLVSLAILNAGREASSERLETRRRSIPVLQALAAVRQRHGSEALGSVYSSLGTAYHEEAASLATGLVGAALVDLGFDGLGMRDEVLAQFQEAVVASHSAAQQRAGFEAGSPLISFNGGRAFFGPVLARVPDLDEADLIFESVRALAGADSFSELKGAR